MIDPNARTIFFTGVVEDRMDPLFLGRVRVRIHVHHSKFLSPVQESELDPPAGNFIPIEELPWAYVTNPIQSAAMTGIGHAPVGPVEGTWVVGIFMDGEDCQLPLILGTIGGIELKDDKQGKDKEPGIGKGSDGLPNEETSGPTAPQNPVELEGATSPVEQGVLGPLSAEDLSNLKAAIGQRESTNNYAAENGIGFIGKYQFGNALLHDLGYTVSTANGNAILGSKANWTGKGGVTSKEDWKTNSATQEKAMDEALAMNYKRLKGNGTITDSSTKEEVAGYLATAHLVGSGGAKSLANGTNKADANGTKASSYYGMGAGAVGGKNTVPKPPASDPGISANKAKPDSQGGQNTDPASFSEDNVGFKDPNKVYPKFDDGIEKRPDTSYMAYQDHIDKTAVHTKEEGRVKAVAVANDATDPWDQPPVPYNAEYPFNHIYESESGHILEFDDTAQNERINLWHRKGSFLEIDKNGTMVTRIVGDGYMIVDQNGYVQISGRANITVGGDANVYVKNRAEVQIDGEAHLVVHNDVRAEISGNLDFSVQEKFNVRAKSIHLEADGSGEAFTITNRGSGDIKITNPAGKIDIYAKKDLSLYSNEKLSVRATGKMVAIDGKVLALQQGASSTASQTSHSMEGDESMFEPDPKRTPTEPDFPTLSTPNRKDKVAFFYDEPGAPPEEVDKYIAKQIENGNYTKEEIEKPGDFEAPDKTEPPAADPVPVEKCPDGFELQENYPPSLQLSANYTLAQLSSGAAVTHDAVKGQRGLKKGEIVCNLRSLANATLESIKAKYPNMFVTSGFRNGSGTSQHEIGQAADMQFTGAKKSEYYDIAVWIRDNCTYDQLILEYKSTGTGNPWIHVSCSQKGNRKQVLTMYNHKVTAGSLQAMNS